MTDFRALSRLGKELELLNIERRMELFSRYEAESNPRRFDFEKIVGSEEWVAYWNDRDKIFDSMKDAQKLAD